MYYIYCTDINPFILLEDVQWIIYTKSSGEKNSFENKISLQILVWVLSRLNEYVERELTTKFSRVADWIDRILDPPEKWMIRAVFLKSVRDACMLGCT